MNLNIPVNINGKVWIADKKYSKPLAFIIDNIHIYEDKNGIQICAHRYRDSGYANFRLPVSYGLKHFGKRIIFKTKKEAEAALNQYKTSKAAEASGGAK